MPPSFLRPVLFSLINTLFSSSNPHPIYPFLPSYMLYMFLVAILFLNLLVAIIVDSYQLVGKDAEASFWLQRMIFILDVNQMQKSCNRIVKCIFCCSKRPPFDSKDLDEMDPNNFYYQKWAAALASFDDKRVIDENGVSVSKFWSNFMRRCACIAIIPCWLLVGFVSAGYFWPPQVRVWLFFARAEKENKNLEEETSASIKQLQTEILTSNQTMYTGFGKIDNRVGCSMKQLEKKIYVLDQTSSTGFGALNRKIDQLAVEIQKFRLEYEESKKMDSKKKGSDTEQIRAEFEDIKKILLSLSKNSQPHKVTVND